MTPKSNHALLYAVLFVIALEAILFCVHDYKMNQALMLEEYRLEQAQLILAKVEIEAKAFSVYDVDEKKFIYGKNDDVALPLASLSKIMTIIAALNTYNTHDILTISEEGLKQVGDYGLFANEKWRVGDLAKLTLLVSANDGAYTFSENIPNFLEKINEKAKKIGAQKALFLTSTGLDIEEGKKASTFASAQDVNIMAGFAYKDYPKIFGATVLPELHLKSESGFDHVFKNTDIILEHIPNLLFSKTGYTNVAGGNLTIIFKNKLGHDIAVTILGSSFEGRFEDMKKIVATLYPL